MKSNEFDNSQMTCVECGGPAFSDLILAEKKDACYNKVRSRYKVWPSAYASGALVQCRKKGAANWGTKSKNEDVAEGQLDEISANPDYLRAAERSRSQAQATQRTFGKSPEEKAAARRTELKRDRGIAGYTKRHRVAHPEMYPKVQAQPAPKLRDPSTEYSDDYSVWAKGQRDTMEQGVAEGSETAADIDKKIEFHKQGQAAAQYKGSMNKMHAAKIRELEAKKQALKQGVAEGRFDEPLTGWHIVYRKSGNPVHATPSFETKDQAQKYLMTKMFANHQDYKIVHTAGVGVAEGLLNELAPSGGDGEGNSHYDYGNSIIQIAEELPDFFDDEGVKSDMAAIRRVGKVFISKGMDAGIDAFYADLDSIVRDHVGEQLMERGFNVRQEIYKPFKDKLAAWRAEQLRKHNEYINSQEYKDRRADDLKISAITLKPIDAIGAKPGESVSSVTMDNASKRNIKAEFEEFKQNLAWRDSLKGVPLKFEITIGGKPIDINKLSEQGVAEAVGLYGPFTATINTGERPKSRTKTKKFRREDDAILWAQDWLENFPQYSFATAEVKDPDGNVVWTTDEEDSPWAPAKQDMAEDRPVDSDGYTVDREDAGEYDYEGDQAKDQLQTIVAAARKLNGMLDDNENMPEWVQMKITKATDYLDTAADYVAANKAQAEPMAEAEPEKIGGRHDPADFDDMVSRLKKLAGAGPMKTVYDPNTRRYRNVPTAQQPGDKK